MIVFASNFMNHHQLPFCLEMIKRYGNDFFFIATEPIPEERIRMGYEDLNNKYEFIIRHYENEDLAETLIRVSDVFILGSAPEKFISLNSKEKLILRYTERPYKNYSKLKSFISECLHHYRYIRYKKIFLLCASAFTAADHAQFGMYQNKMYKWGYFPSVISYDIDELLKRKLLKKKIRILWVGRLISLKHPEMAIRIAKRLVEEGYDFELEIIGVGELFDELNGMISKYQLSKYIEMYGAITPLEVRTRMEKGDIFLFTSDRNEGWGAVLNEAMNSGCSVVASSSIGAVPFLIKHGYNGYIYKNGNFNELFYYVKKLITHNNERIQLGKHAYDTIYNEWSPESAAIRLIGLIDCISKNKESIYKSGPCSFAEVIKEGDIDGRFSFGNNNNI